MLRKKENREQLQYCSTYWHHLHKSILNLRPPFTLMRFRLTTHTFYTFLPIVHAKPVENADENGGFRKLFSENVFVF